MMLTTDTVTEQAGGKGASLLRLERAGFPVPPFVIITPDDFEGDGRVKSAVLGAVKRAFAPDTLLAVRSSASLEDSADYSFAGQFLTRLEVPLGDLEGAIQDVWRSSANERVRAYKRARQIDAPHQMSVVVQCMVPATASGVAFGLNPLTGNRAEIVINAIRGLGEALVSGSVNADEYVISGETMRKKLTTDRAVLDDEQIQTVVDATRALGQTFSCPQDCEFAFENDTFWLLQARPVTTAYQRDPIIWDNSNIVESYPDLTLPLTFSFIQTMYAAVYRQFSGIMGVSSATIRRNEPIYRNMLGLLNGRVYYNLNSWFRALAQLPGYALNADFMERMMGVKEKFPLPVPTEKKSRLRVYVDLGRAVLFILKNLVTARWQRRAFIRFFDKVYAPYDAQDLNQKSLSDILRDYRTFEHLMVSGWKAPLVNDFFAMIYFGLLQKMTDSLAPGLHNALVASSHDIITTQPTKLLPALARRIAENDALRQSFIHDTPEGALISLQQPAHVAVRNLFDDYIQTWGDRSLAELKLETVTYRQQPLLLVEVLQMYVRQELFSLKEAPESDQNRQRAETRIARQLRGKPLKKWLFGHVLNQARYFISNRENLRYYRTKGFGMVRRMLLAAGKRLAQAGQIETATDVFYLKLDELLSGPDARFRERVAERKKEYALYEQLPLPQRVTTHGMPDSLILQPQPVLPQLKRSPSTQLSGLACSPGVVRATVRLVTHLAQIHTLNGCILATYSTDPGWVILFPSAAGILTERGSLLSHAAIVSREMGLPCIVGVTGLMTGVKDGDEILMDGSTGQIKIMNW